MLRLLKLELKNLSKPVIVTTSVLTVLTCILTCVLQRDYTIYFHIDAWEIGTEYLGLLFPLFVTVPTCWQLYYERRNRFLVYTLSRASKRRYLGTKWLACALSAFCILFVPYTLSALCALYVVEPRYLFPTPEKYNHVFFTLYTQFPALYALLLSLWKGILGVLTMSFGFTLALFLQNIFVILMAPFVYVILDNFFWSIFRIANAFVTAFEPSAWAPNVVTPMTYFFGPFQMCVFIAVVSLFCLRVKKRSIYPI